MFPSTPRARRRARLARVAAVDDGGRVRAADRVRSAQAIAASHDAGGRAAAASCWAPRPPRTRSRAARATTGPSGRRGAIPTAARTWRTAPPRRAPPTRGTCGASDLAALQLMGANVYRLGVEWSRLEPTPGVWDAAAAARYREMFAGLRAAGIAPMVTLYHFTLPTWVAARGGWEWEGDAARRSPRSRGGPGRRSAIWSTGGARSTSRTCWWPRATWPGSGRPASRDPAPRRARAGGD